MNHYTVEIHVDVEADGPEQAWEKAHELAAQAGGKVTTVFDPEWEEV